MTDTNSKQFAAGSRPQLPDVLSKGPISPDAQYFRIDKASEFLECSPADLLHLGVIGKATIIAPVVCEGTFEWPAEADLRLFPELGKPLKATFDASHRVILTQADLAKIEGIGWVIPKFFYAPEIANHLIEEVANRQDPLQERGNENIVSEETQQLREFMFHSRWIPAGYAVYRLNEDGTEEDVSNYVHPAYSPEKVTKIDHLFISKFELLRLWNGSPQSEVAENRSLSEYPNTQLKNIGYLDRHASIREFMWKAAIFTLGSLLKPKIPLKDLIAKIESELMTRWPDEKHSSSKQMMNLISKALKGD